MKIILVLVLAFSLNAGFLKGTDLAKYKTEYEKMYKKNKKIDFYKAGAYVYYILGIFDTLDDTVVCVKRGATEKEILNTVGKYIDDYPEQLNSSAKDIITRSLTDTFPCSDLHIVYYFYLTKINSLGAFSFWNVPPASLINPTQTP